MATIDKVRIIVAGDSGIGKTSLCSLIAYNEVCRNPAWTVGCSVEVKIHEYKEGTPSQNTYFIEMWDIGGSISHKNTRGVYYYPTNGIILVHDLTNRKSQENLKSWLLEILNKDGKDTGKNGNTMIDGDLDPEEFFGSTQIPILIVGTKADLVDQAHINKSSRFSDIVQADEISMNCHDSRCFSPGSSNSVKLSRFFDKVIERKYFSSNNSTIYEKRHFTSSTPFTSPLTSPLNSFIGYTSPVPNYSTLNQINE